MSFSVITSKTETLQFQLKIMKDNRSYTFEIELLVDYQKSDCLIRSVILMSLAKCRQRSAIY